MTNPDEPSSSDAGRPRPLAITPAGLIGTVVLAAIVLVFLRLGFWQMARLSEQRDLNAGIAARLEAPAIDDAAALTDTSGLFYRTVSLRGTYDNDRSIVLPGRSLRSLPGVHVLTPLRVAGRTDAVLVNRGWAPSADAATVDVRDFARADSVTVRGIVLPFPDRTNSLAPPERVRDEDGGFRRVWYAIDEEQLRAQYPYEMLPAMVQELPLTERPARSPWRSANVAAGGGPRYPERLDPPPLSDGPHLGYALQWFSFAIVGLIGWVALVLRGRNPPRSAPPAALAALLLAGVAIRLI